jgi:type IV pilus assembly protein PilX
MFVLLSALLAVWASRTSLFSEMVVGNDVDYQRAFEAAQALLQDAELDITGQNANGSVCTGTGNVCRTTTVDKIPLEDQEMNQLLATLANESTGCRNALCTRRGGEQDFWNDDTTLNNMKTVGARYGTYTGAANTSTTGLNPILTEKTDDDKGGWYWIEILPYDDTAANQGLLAAQDVNANLLPIAGLKPNAVYRITALAYGRKANTRVVLQQTYAPQRPLN